MSEESEATLLAGLYHDAAQLIAFFKRQQVITTAYVVAVHAVSIALVNNPSGGDRLRILMWWVSLLAVVVGFFIVCQLERGLFKTRRRAKDYKAEFPQKLQDIITRRPEEESSPMFVYCVLLLSQAIGLMVVTSLLLKW